MKDDLDLISKKILALKTSGQRKKLKSLEKKRADIIPAGIIILQQIFDLFKIENLTVSDYALREGIILETMNGFGNPG